MQGNLGEETILCRLSLRNRCSRGRSCPFYHPEFNFNPDSPTVTWLDFCRDFQRGQCSQSDCRRFHVTLEEEDLYRMRKDIAPTLLEQAMRKALLFDVALTGSKATCKRFLQGGCSLNRCHYRHVTRQEFANEVLNTLRNEFEVVLGAFGTDIPGLELMQSSNMNSSNTMSNMNNSNIMNMNPMMPMVGNKSSTETLDEKVARLERENEEIFMALNPNQAANSLEEIRAKLLNLQSALEGFDRGDTGMNRGPGFASGQLNAILGNSGIDSMRRDTMPRQEMYGGNRGFSDNYDNPPMDLDRDRGGGFSDRRSKGGDRKLFIGGLDYATNTEILRNYFSRFGELADAVVIEDKITKRSRGFGFVTFDSPAMAQDAFSSGPHRIDGAIVDVSFAQPKNADGEDSSRTSTKRRSSPDRGRGDREKKAKLFVGNLSDNITTDVLRNYFSRFGPLIDCVSMVDTKKRPRGFGFIEYEDWRTCEVVLNDTHHVIMGREVQVRIPKPRDETGGPSRGSDNDRSGGSERSRREAGGSTRSGSGVSSRRDDSSSGDNKTDGEDPCKMFVGGLNPTTNEDDLRDYFSKFGDVRDVKVNRYPDGNCKGFGFIFFYEAYMVQDVMDQGPHEVNGRRIDTGFPQSKKKNDRSQSQRTRDSSPESNSEPVYKIFVGNLSKDTNEEDLYDYFSRYGEVKDTSIRTQKASSRFFGFVIFNDKSSMEDAVEDGPHRIGGRELIVEASHHRTDKCRNKRRDRSPDSSDISFKRRSDRSHLD